MSVTLEIAVQDADGVSSAAGGADRIELCTGLALGGLTPSAALIRLATAGAIPVHVLVRPRAGGFEYTDVERGVILDDIEAALGHGAAGVVVGATVGGRVDQQFIRQARRASEGRELTFHRAFDTVDDRDRALLELIEAGVDRVLTSGGASCAPDALPELHRLVDAAHGRIQIMAGGGITAQSIADVAGTGVTAIHASAKGTITERIPVQLGSASPGGSQTREVTDRSQIAALRAGLLAWEERR